MKISREFKVGLLAIISGTILYIGFNFLKGIDLFSSTKKYYAYYDNIGGLTISNPVTLNGFTIGRVSDISIIQEQKNKVQVEFDIQEDIIIGKSSKAELTTDLLGSKSVVLKMKEGDVPLAAEGTIEGVVEQGLLATIKDTTDPLKATMLNINQLISGFKDTKIYLDSLLISFNGTTNRLNTVIAGNQRNLEKITSDLVDLTSMLKDEQDGVAPLLAGFNNFADSLGALELTKTIDNLNNTLSALESTLNNVNKGSGSMAKLMNDDSLYQNLNNTARDLDLLLIDFRENPKRYVNFSVFGRKDK